MSNINEQFKEFINEAIDNSFHNNIEMKIILKEWLQIVYSQGTKANEYETKAKAFDRICEAMDYHYPSENDRKYLNGYQHPKASLKDIDAIINKYESGESE